MSDVPPVLEARGAPVARSMWAALALLLLAALAHGPSIRGAFVYDDHWTLVDNPLIRDPANVVSLPTRGPAKAGVPDAGRPLMLLSATVDFAAWRFDPRGYHAQSLAWHAGVAILLMLLVTRMFGLATGLPAAALFTVLPIGTEPVAAINYREDLLSTFFVLAALLAIEAGRAARITWLWRSLAGACALLATLAKESAAVLPLLLIVRDLATRESGDGDSPSQRARAYDVVALGLPVALVFAWRWWLFGAPGVVSHTAEIAESHRALSYRLPAGALALVKGLAQTVVPWGLSPEYEDPGAPVVAGWLALIGVIALVAACAARHRRLAPAVRFGILGSLVAYLPTVGLVPLTNLRADRYLYLSSALLCVALAGEGGRRLHAHTHVSWRATNGGIPAATLGLVLLLATLTVVTRRQGRIWRDDRALWTRATEIAPGSPRSWTGLAEAQLRAGRSVEALASVDRALTLGEAPLARGLRGLVLMAQGDRTGAHGDLERAASSAPAAHRPELLNNLGISELAMGQHDRAIQRFAEARALAPLYEEPWLNEARAHAQAGRRDASLAMLQRFVERVPTAGRGWRALGDALLASGRDAEAHVAFTRARTLGVHGTP